MRQATRVIIAKMIDATIGSDKRLINAASPINAVRQTVDRMTAFLSMGIIGASLPRGYCHLGLGPAGGEGLGLRARLRQHLRQLGRYILGCIVTHLLRLD
jgi:hypothetical protein